jgi:hypothetical protein
MKMPKSSEREARIRELVKWANKKGIGKQIPRDWFLGGSIPSWVNILQWDNLMTPIIAEAQKRFMVSKKTAQDYAHVVIELLIQRRQSKKKVDLEKQKAAKK